MRTQLQGAQHLQQQQVSPVMLLRRPAAIRTCRAAGQRVVQPHIALARQIRTLATPDVSMPLLLAMVPSYHMLACIFGVCFVVTGGLLFVKCDECKYYTLLIST